MRRARRAGHRPATRDRWMVSYADMVTLLFACFAALYASSLMPVSASPETTVPAMADTGARLAATIRDALAPVDPNGDVVVSAEARGVVVSLPEAGSFGVGQADLSQAARRVIRELATVLEQETGDIRIEGHTDDVPITTSRFASNWDLSAARATEVIRFLLAQTALAPQRLSAAGYGEFRPVVANTSEEQRAKNRRVDIVIHR